MKSNNGTWRFKRSLAALAVSTILGVAGSAYAADTSNLTGSVTGAAPGYKVKASDPKTGFNREIQLDGTGTFRFSQLPVGSYVVTIEKDGKVVAQDNIRLALGSNSVARFELNRPTDGTEVIQVTGARVVAVDLSSTDSGLVLGEVEIDKLPVARNLTAVQLLAPGAVKGDTRFGNTASFAGSSVAENSCYINGLEVTNTRQGLGCGSVPFEFYKEFQVKTGGYSAMYGRTTGGVTNAITKSGTNDWEFGFTAYHQPGSLAGEGRKSYAQQGSSEVFYDSTQDELTQTDYSLSAGGALIEDKLFFYGIINPRSSDDLYTTGNTRFAVTNNLREQKASGGDNLFWGSKIDWDIVDGHRLSLFGYSDRRDVTERNWRYNAQTGVQGAETGGFVRARGGEVMSASYVGNITDDLTVSALWGNIETQYTDTPAVINCPTITDNRTTGQPKAVQCGSGGTIGVDYDDNTQIRFDVEYNLEFYGNHTLKVGLDKQDRQSKKTTAPVGDHAYTYVTVAPNGAIQGNNGVLFRNTTNAPKDYVRDRIFAGGGEFSSDLSAYYLEDNYQVNDQLMLSVGLRQDHFINTGVTGVDFADLKTDWAPRLGFTYDPTGEGTSKIFATWGRYYLPIPNNTNYRAAGGISDSTTYYTFTGVNASNGAPTGLTPVNGSPENSRIVNSFPVELRKEAFQAEEAEPFAKDELILGYETQINEDLTGSVRGIFREVSTALDDFCGPTAPSCVILNPGKGGTWWQDSNHDGVPDAGSRKYYTAAEIALPDAKNEYLGLQSELKYRGEKFSGSIIYTWSRSYGNFEGAVKSDIAQADAGITQDFDFPAVMDGSDGYQPNDRRHVLKMFGSYAVTEDLDVGFNATLSSGKPVSAFGQGYPSDDPLLYGSYGDTFYHYTNQCPDANGNGKCEQSEKVYTFHPRGSAGRTPWTFNVDMSVGYNFNVSGVDLRASVDVFNILDIQEVTAVNEHYENNGSEGTFNRFYGQAMGWQAPRTVRFGITGNF
ncbi:MAG: TonB-dependent receptor [Rheinheimera sp.]|nr:TonB-dependent receptor [Rheinheimera sp.]